MPRFSCLLLAQVVFILSFSDPQAKILHVDGDIGLSSNDGSQWTQGAGNVGPKGGIRNALLFAVSGDEIWVKKGTYAPTGLTDTASLTGVSIVMKTGVGLYGGFDGFETTRLERLPVNPADTVIDVTGTGANFVVGFETTSDATIEGFTLTHAAGSSQASPQAGGGVAVRDASNVFIYDCLISENYSQTAGGGISLNNATAWIRGCTIVDNEAARDRASVINIPPLPPRTVHIITGTGGGINIVDSTATISDCQIRDNSSYVNGGGAFIINASVSLSNCIVSSNRSIKIVLPAPFSSEIERGWGGGISLANSLFSLKNVEISNNAGLMSGGGLNLVEATGELYHCDLVGNRSRLGAGLYQDRGEVIANHCRFYANRAGSTGITLRSTSIAAGGFGQRLGSTTFINCDFLGNSTDFLFSSLDSGACIRLLSGSLTLVNCNLSYTRSSSAYDGAIYINNSIFESINSVFYKNQYHAIYESSGNNSEVILENSLFYDNPDGDYFKDGSVSLTGAGMLNAATDSANNIDGFPVFAMYTAKAGISGVWDATSVVSGLTIAATAMGRFQGLDLTDRYINPNLYSEKFGGIDLLYRIIDNTDDSVTITPIAYVGDVTVGDQFRVIDLHLEAGSPAIDAGKDVTFFSPETAIDFEGVPRGFDGDGRGPSTADGSDFDIGLYEFTGELPQSVERWNLFR